MPPKTAEPPAPPAASPTRPPEVRSPWTAEGSSGGAFVPNDGPANRDAVPLTTVESIPAFMLKYHPNRWVIIDGNLAPLFGRLRLIAGVNGVNELRRSDGTISINAGLAKSQAQDAGWTLIPYDAIPDSWVRPGEPKSYIWRPRGRPDVCLLRTEQVFPGSSEIRQDMPAYLAWCKWLIERGYVKPCPLYVLRRMLDDAQERLATASDKVSTVPSARATVDRLARDIKALQLAIAAAEEANGPPVPLDSTGGGFTPELGNV